MGRRHFPSHGYNITRWSERNVLNITTVKDEIFDY